MKQKIFTILIALLLLLPMAFGAGATREMPSTASPDAQVTITITATGAPSSYFALVRENIPSGWTYVSGGELDGNQVKFFLTNLAGGSISYTLQAPSSGTHTFSGTVHYADDASASNIGGDTSVTVNADPGCSCTSWVSGNCVGEQRQQTRTCTPSGCLSQSQLVADTSCETISCTNGETQSCTTGGCAGIRTCSSGSFGSCVKDDASCESTALDCEFWEKEDKETGECEVNVGMIILFVIGLFALKMMR